MGGLHSLVPDHTGLVPPNPLLHTANFKALQKMPRVTGVHTCGHSPVLPRQAHSVNSTMALANLSPRFWVNSQRDTPSGDVGR